MLSTNHNLPPTFGQLLCYENIRIADAKIAQYPLDIFTKSALMQAGRDHFVVLPGTAKGHKAAPSSLHLCFKLLSHSVPPSHWREGGGSDGDAALQAPGPVSCPLVPPAPWSCPIRAAGSRHASHPPPRQAAGGKRCSTTRWIWGRLAGSVGRTSNFRSRGLEFKPDVGRRVSLNK